MLSLMRGNAYISESQCAHAIPASLLLSSHPRIDAAGAPYFLDLVNDELRTSNRNRLAPSTPRSISICSEPLIQRLRMA